MSSGWGAVVRWSYTLLVIGAMGCSSKNGSLLADPQPLRGQDVTHLVTPIYDGYVSAIMVVNGKVCSFVSGSKQACYEGWLREAPSAGNGAPVEILRLGVESTLSKERGARHDTPRLVAALDSNRFLLNLNCSEVFPQPGPGSGYTGNVVLFDRATTSFQNLTQLDGTDPSRQYVAALEWSPEDNALLVEVSDLGPSDTPMPAPGTGRGACFSLDDLAFRPLADYPRLLQLYETRRAVIVEQCASSDHLWQVRLGDGRVIIPPGPMRPSLVTALDDESILLGIPGGGTWLVNESDGALRRLSDDAALWFDRPAETLYLRSAQKVSQHPGIEQEDTRFYALPLPARRPHTVKPPTYSSAGR
jgi:hypothetical protein